MREAWDNRAIGRWNDWTSGIRSIGRRFLFPCLLSAGRGKKEGGKLTEAVTACPLHNKSAASSKSRAERDAIGERDAMLFVFLRTFPEV